MNDDNFKALIESMMRTLPADGQQPDVNPVKDNQVLKDLFLDFLTHDINNAAKQTQWMEYFSSRAQKVSDLKGYGMAIVLNEQVQKALVLLERMLDLKKQWELSQSNELLIKQINQTQQAFNELVENIAYLELSGQAKNTNSRLTNLLIKHETWHLDSQGCKSAVSNKENRQVLAPLIDRLYDGYTKEPMSVKLTQLMWLINPVEHQIPVNNALTQLGQKVERDFHDWSVQKRAEEFKSNIEELRDFPLLAYTFNHTISEERWLSFFLRNPEVKNQLVEVKVQINQDLVSRFNDYSIKSFMDENSAKMVENRQDIQEEWFKELTQFNPTVKLLGCLHMLYQAWDLVDKDIFENKKKGLIMQIQAWYKHNPKHQIMQSHALSPLALGRHVDEKYAKQYANVCKQIAAYKEHVAGGSGDFLSIEISSPLNRDILISQLDPVANNWSQWPSEALETYFIERFQRLTASQRLINQRINQVRALGVEYPIDVNVKPEVLNALIMQELVSGIDQRHYLDHCLSLSALYLWVKNQKDWPNAWFGLQSMDIEKMVEDKINLFTKILIDDPKITSLVRESKHKNHEEEHRKYTNIENKLDNLTNPVLPLMWIHFNDLLKQEIQRNEQLKKLAVPDLVDKSRLVDDNKMQWLLNNWLDWMALYKPVDLLTEYWLDQIISERAEDNSFKFPNIGFWEKDMDHMINEFNELQKKLCLRCNACFEDYKITPLHVYQSYVRVGKLMNQQLQVSKELEFLADSSSIILQNAAKVLDYMSQHPIENTKLREQVIKQVHRVLSNNKALLADAFEDDENFLTWQKAAQKKLQSQKQLHDFQKVIKAANPNESTEKQKAPRL